MRVLALDLSTKSGWAFFDTKKAQPLLDYGHEIVEVTDFNVNDFPEKSPLYPWNILTTAGNVADIIEGLIAKFSPDIVVVENTVRGKNRHTQRILEWIHLSVLSKLLLNKVSPEAFKYMDVSEWRKELGISLSSEDKRKNAKLSRAKQYAKNTGQKLDKTKLGIRGRVNKKHLSVRFVNEKYGMSLKVKDNDIADSICIGTAYIQKYGEENGQQLE